MLVHFRELRTGGLSEFRWQHCLQRSLLAVLELQSFCMLLMSSLSESRSLLTRRCRVHKVQICDLTSWHSMHYFRFSFHLSAIFSIGKMIDRPLSPVLSLPRALSKRSIGASLATLPAKSLGLQSASCIVFGG